jgi:C_GCAxxG_C_C family probable redox protein
LLDYEVRLNELKLQGYCCNQIMIMMGLEALDKEENEDLINVMSGLCNGLYSGLLCGVLSGGACLLSLYDPEKAASHMINELVEWFTQKYGTVNCNELVGEDMMGKIEKCPLMITETYEKILELLEENDCSIWGE